MPERIAKRVLLIGWDSADWKVINPLLDAGLMPTLNSLIEGGVMGNIATLAPALSPMLWTSIATGKRADKHGILSFVEPAGQDGGIRPVMSTSRQCKAVWNILNQRGLKSTVVNWFASHPAEPIHGAVVTNSFPQVRVKEGQPVPLAPGVVHPARLADQLAGLRVQAREITAEHLLPFVPLAGKIDQDKDRRLETLARLLGQCFSVHAAATWLLEYEPFDFMAVYYDTIDRVCHEFMRHHPPRMEGVSEEEFAIYKDVVSGIYRYHDMMLERLLQLAGPDTTVILLSDHGFHSDHLRPRGPAGPVAWHRPFGIVCMRGPRIQKDERVYGASLLDITPTILTLLGLPVGKDMEGRPLRQAFDGPVEVEQIESWETVAGDAGQHPADTRVNPLESQAAIEQLVALGYINAPPADKQKAAAEAASEMKRTLATVLLDANRPAETATLVEEQLRAEPKNRTLLMMLAKCRRALDQPAECRRLIETILADDAAAPAANLLLGSLLTNEDRPTEALAYLLKAEQADPRLPNLHCQIGDVYLRQNRWKDAERAFRKALQIDGDSAPAHCGLASALLGERRFPEAAGEAVIAVGLMHHYPRAHYVLGVALVRAGYPLPAVSAFETVVTMRPRLPSPHHWLAQLYEKVVKDPVKAAEHARLYQQLSVQPQPKAEFPTEPPPND